MVIIVSCDELGHLCDGRNVRKECDEGKKGKTEGMEGIKAWKEGRKDVGSGVNGVHVRWLLITMAMVGLRECLLFNHGHGSGEVGYLLQCTHVVTK
jgi:hypothetical protein